MCLVSELNAEEEISPTVTAITAIEVLNDVELCYVAALAYGLSIIDEKAAARHELHIPINPAKERTLPEIDFQALRDFVQVVGTRIVKANL